MLLKFEYKILLKFIFFKSDNILCTIKKVKKNSFLYLDII
jgi:hypothetical protein